MRLRHLFAFAPWRVSAAAAPVHAAQRAPGNSKHGAMCAWAVPKPDTVRADRVRSANTGQANGQGAFLDASVQGTSLHNLLFDHSMRLRAPTDASAGRRTRLRPPAEALNPGVHGG